MKKLITTFCCLIIVWATYAQTQKDKAGTYINLYKDLAIEEMIRTGVPASITLAQGILESSYGESDLCKQSNNHFGIKCKENWTGEKVYHDDDSKGECFRSYPTALDSYKDHSDFLKNRPYYTSLFDLDPADYKSWAKGLKKAGYATEKDYPQRLIQLIESYNLNQYTLLAIQQKNNPKQDFAANDAVIRDTVLGEIIIPVSSKQLKTRTEDKDADDEASTMVAKEDVLADKPKSTAPATYPDNIFSINHTKVIYAKEGTSLLSIANQYDITLSKLIEFNDISETDILSADQLIFIEKKLKKGATDYHVIKENESLHDVSQVEGVRLESILEYNNLKKEDKPVTGSKIYLKSGIIPAVTKSNSSGKKTTK